MNAPQFSKGQTLAASDLNALAQSVRDLSARVGRAGLASRYVGPSPLRPLVESTGQPVYLAPADVGGSGGIYVRQPGVEDSLRLQMSSVLAPVSLKRSDGSDLQAGDEIFQKITVDEWGNPLSSTLAVVNSGSAPPTATTWDPATATSGVLFHRLGSVIADPRVDSSVSFRPFVVLYNNGSVPILPLPAAADSGSVQLVAPLNGSTLPIKNLVAGEGVTLTDYASSVTLSSTGSGGSALTKIVYGGTDTPYISGDTIYHPYAEISTNGDILSGVIRGVVYEDASAVLPYFASGVLYVPPNGGSEISSIYYSAQTKAPTISNGVITHPFADSSNGIATSGVLSGIIEEDASAVLPYLASGNLYVPPASPVKGLVLSDGSAVNFPDLYTDGAMVSPLASFEFELASGIMARFTLCAHYSDGYLKFEFRQG